jgi:type VI secretion system FHA domain protein
VELILEVVSPQAASLGRAARQTFGPAGGTIGRETSNSLVLPNPKVSGRHAVITFVGGVFYIEDTSRNGVFLNSLRDRLPRNEPQPLSSGDRLLIDDYEISVSVSGGDRPVRGRAEAMPDADPFDLLGDAGSDPFAPLAPQQMRSSSAAFDAPDSVSREELDPLELLNLHDDRPAPRKAPSARDLDAGSPLDQHFRPPVAVPDPRMPRPAPPPASPLDPLAIPQDYDPLADEPLAPPPPRPAPPRPPVVERAAPPPPPEPPPRQAPSVERAAPSPPPLPLSDAPAPVRPRFGKPRVDSGPADADASPSVRPSGGTARGADLGAVLEGAGLNAADVTPELAHVFGEIIRVVVTGVMDVLQSRREIKDEFRMRMTQFRPAENNPLKFSANVEDALHNLLVKRNAAYLGPVEAFEDAFTDLRNHQLAMLAGMRVAFESMLAEFDPDRLQEDFDRQAPKGLVPAKLRYWDMFRDKRREMTKDPEATFRQLFGEEFARAYEEQLKQLRTREAGAAGDPPTERRPKDS